MRPLIRRLSANAPAGVGILAWEIPYATADSATFCQCAGRAGQPYNVYSIAVQSSFNWGKRGKPLSPAKLRAPRGPGRSRRWARGHPTCRKDVLRISAWKREPNKQCCRLDRQRGAFWGPPFDCHW